MFKSIFVFRRLTPNGGPGPSNLKINCENGPVQIIFDATTSSGTPALVGFIAGKSSDQWNDLGTNILRIWNYFRVLNLMNLKLFSSSEFDELEIWSFLQCQSL